MHAGHHGHEFFDFHGDFRGDFHGDFHGGGFGGSEKFEKGDLNAALNFFDYGFRQAVGFGEVLGQFYVVPKSNSIVINGALGIRDSLLIGELGA